MGGVVGDARKRLAARLVAEPTLTEAEREALTRTDDEHDYPTETDDGLVMRCRCGATPPAHYLGQQVDEALWLWEHRRRERFAVVEAILAARLAPFEAARDEMTRVMADWRDECIRWRDAAAEHDADVAALRRQVADLTTERNQARDDLHAYLDDPPQPVGADEIANWQSMYDGALDSERNAWQEVERLREELAESRACEGDDAALLARAEAAERTVAAQAETIARVRALHDRVHWCFGGDPDNSRDDIVFEPGTEWWPCPTLAALATPDAEPSEPPFVSGYCEAGSCDRCVQGPEFNLDGRMLVEECTHGCHDAEPVSPIAPISDTTDRDVSHNDTEPPPNDLPTQEDTEPSEEVER